MQSPPPAERERERGWAKFDSFSTQTGNHPKVDLRDSTGLFIINISSSLLTVRYEGSCDAFYVSVIVLAGLLKSYIYLYQLSTSMTEICGGFCIRVNGVMLVPPASARLSAVCVSINVS